jgi:hypothetical protein
VCSINVDGEGGRKCLRSSAVRKAEHYHGSTCSSGCGNNSNKLGWPEPYKCTVHLYMTVCLAVSLPILPYSYIHRARMALADLTKNMRCRLCCDGSACVHLYGTPVSRQISLTECHISSLLPISFSVASCSRLSLAFHACHPADSSRNMPQLVSATVGVTAIDILSLPPLFLLPPCL